MRKFLLLAVLMVLCFPLIAQNNVNNRVLSAKADFDDETLKGNLLIDVFECDGKDHVYKGIAVRAVPTSDSSTYELYLYDRYVGISSDKVRVDPINQQAFLEAMDMIRTKYVEWSAVAKKNKITDFHKEIELNSRVIVYEYTVSALKPENSWLSAYFDVDEKGKTSVSLYFTHESKREYYSDYDFYSLDKLDHLIYIIQPEYVLKVIEQTQKRIDELKKAEQERDNLFK